ncbi:hypothetical protein VB775_16275 [Pseudanabaena sp. CCNP1317]|nr:MULTISPECIES: hypothetical protein [Pseudanabaena]MEA5488373.1 hypothetical protein [Pseudanabaena sp. CCNP1317]WGS74561.1 hypothetical protein OA858_01880 [Pseudanabaena galeata CCNP1313]
MWRMRDFYLACHGNEKLTPLVAEIGWTHNLVILEKCKVYSVELTLNEGGASRRLHLFGFGQLL